MSDDDKKGPESDPWANLDAEAPGVEGDAFAFAFEEIDDAKGERSPSHVEPTPEPWPVEPSTAAGDAAAPTDAPASSDQDSWDGIVAETIAVTGPAREIPLAVFPPADGDAALGFGEVDGEILDDVRAAAAAVEADGPFDTEQSGIIAMTDVNGGFGGSDPVADGGFPARGETAASGGDDHDSFDDAALARELAGGAAADAADFGDHASESPSEEVSFQAGLFGNTSPFAEPVAAEAFGSDAASIHESTGEESASVPMVAGLATAGAAAAAAAVRPVPPSRKKGSGLGQLIGIVLGGLLAIPITFAILIWGFQKDPFKFARHVPPQWAFLLPQSLQAGGGTAAAPPRRTAAPDLSQARSLDDVATVDAGGATAPADGDAPDVANGDVTAPAGGDAPALADGDMAAPAEGDAPDVADDEAPVPAEGDGAKIVGRAKDMAAAADAASAHSASDDDAQALAAAKPLMDMDADAVAVPAPALDALAALVPAAVTPAAVTPAAIVAPEPRPLDLARLEAAAAKAAHAYDDLAAMPQGDDPARQKLLVGWYRQLARLGEELAALEHAATSAGRPLDDTPESAGGVLERVRGDDTAVGDLVRLGGMWMTSQRRQSDGVILVATVEGVRRVGPYWSTRAVIADAGDGGAKRSVAVISRTQPAADAGDRVLVSGVLFDGDAVWAVDVRPLAGTPVNADADGL